MFGAGFFVSCGLEFQELEIGCPEFRRIIRLPFLRSDAIVQVDGEP